ncbi:MAG TPA: ABC transporter permease [Gemmataceae bacterium]|nr:ABC transporter permease [Gemmataceae bacterium]
MRHLLEIAQTGLAAVRLHPLRSLVCVAALVAVLLPYLVGLGLSKGLEDEAEASANFGADLYVSGSQFGRPVPIPLEAVDRVRRIDGVTEVVPRIVGEVVLGKDQEHAVLVGLPPERFADWAGCVEGRLPQEDRPNELVIGTALARRLKLTVGSRIPPFYHNRQGDKTSSVVGVFKSDAPLWQSRLVLASFETAAAVFDQPMRATDLLVSCRPGYQATVSRAIVGLTFAGSDGGAVRPRVTAREDLLALLPRGLRHREGIFTLHFVLAFVVGILVLLVTSGVGLAERRREIGILKATGWQTDEVLLRGLTESFALSLSGACLALLLAWVWLRVFNGYGIAGLFLAGAGAAPDFAVPFRLTPIPAVLAFVLSFVVVLTGTLYSSWRAATTAPLEAMR